MTVLATIVLGAGLVLSGPDSSGFYHLDASHLEINSGCIDCDADLFAPKPFAPLQASLFLRHRPAGRPVTTVIVRTRG